MTRIIFRVDTLWGGIPWHRFIYSGEITFIELLDLSESDYLFQYD